MKLHELGNEIKILRKQKNLTQEILSNKAGISRVTLGKIERGEMGNVSIKTLDLILNELNKEISFKTKSAFLLPSLDEVEN